ncbi:hypothetical protein I3760_02G047000 [Carya illinoinensis]|nr:hypothetical protein I3760_02G047000 [Carya illinoinensis]
MLFCYLSLVSFCSNFWNFLLFGTRLEGHAKVAYLVVFSSRASACSANPFIL